MKPGYVYRGKQRCSHIGKIYDPGKVEVCTVPCPTCQVGQSQPCVQGLRSMSQVVSPHARRYIAHHDANCTEGGRR